MYLGAVVSQTMGMFFASVVGISADDYRSLWALVAIKIVCILLSFFLLPMVPSEAAVAQAVGAASVL